jgi:hypothetical protein
MAIHRIVLDKLEGGDGGLDPVSEKYGNLNHQAGWEII